MTYTNERRARKTNNSFLYGAFSDRIKYKLSRDTSILSVLGTLDSLRVSIVKKYEIRKWRKRKKGI